MNGDRVRECLGLVGEQGYVDGLMDISILFFLSLVYYSTEECMFVGDVFNGFFFIVLAK